MVGDVFGLWASEDLDIASRLCELFVDVEGVFSSNFIVVDDDVHDRPCKGFGV